MDRWEYSPKDHHGYVNIKDTPTARNADLSRNASDYFDRYRQTEPLTEGGDLSDADRDHIRHADALNVASIADDEARRRYEMDVARALATGTPLSHPTRARTEGMPASGTPATHADDYRAYLRQIGEPS